MEHPRDEVDEVEGDIEGEAVGMGDMRENHEVEEDFALCPLDRTTAAVAEFGRTPDVGGRMLSPVGDEALLFRGLEACGVGARPPRVRPFIASDGLFVVREEKGTSLGCEDCVTSTGLEIASD